MNEPQHGSLLDYGLKMSKRVEEHQKLITDINRLDAPDDVRNLLLRIVERLPR